MRYAIFIGCQIPARLEAYEAGSRAVLSELGVALEEIPEFGCCGYPMRGTHRRAALLSAARNLALAEEAGTGILALCKCCFGSLRHAAHALGEDRGLLAEVNAELGREGLAYEGRAEVKHLLTVLHRDVGVERIAERVTAPLSGVRVAAHYGCHALRPSAVTGFDDPADPTLFEELVAATGAVSVPWEERTRCCGAPVTAANPVLAAETAGAKLAAALGARADHLCSACPYCHLQLRAMGEGALRGAEGGGPEVTLYPELLAKSFGIRL